MNLKQPPPLRAIQLYSQSSQVLIGYDFNFHTRLAFHTRARSQPLTTKFLRLRVVILETERCYWPEMDHLCCKSRDRQTAERLTVSEGAGPTDLHLWSYVIVVSGES